MTTATFDAYRPGSDALVLTAALAGALAVRVAVAGSTGVASVPAGVVFAALLAAVALVARPSAGWSRRALASGIVGAAVVALPALVVLHVSDARPVSAYAGWAAATTLVAISEEAVLRGALFAALSRWRGSDVAVVGAAVAFALLHVPLYGWRVLPVDLAVGLLLGGLRVVTGGWAAPAVAHAGADLVGWWLA